MDSESEKDDRQYDPATMEDMQCITLRRTKIEQWIDEPFFNDTLIGAFVKVRFSSKCVIAQIKGIKEDLNAQYSLTNGVKTGIYLQLMINEDRSDKYKWFKIIQVSNSEIIYDEYNEFKSSRNVNKIKQLTMKLILKKEDDIYNARNYTY